MDIRTIAIFLLVLRLISVVFMVLVIYKQLRLVRLPSTRYIRLTRVALLVLSIAIFLGNMIPIYVDWATAFAHLPRSTDKVNSIGVIYALDNAFTAVMSSAALWAVYKLAAMAARAGENKPKE